MQIKTNDENNIQNLQADIANTAGIQRSATEAIGKRMYLMVAMSTRPAALLLKAAVADDGGREEIGKRKLSRTSGMESIHVAGQIAAHGIYFS